MFNLLLKISFIEIQISFFFFFLVDLKQFAAYPSSFFSLCKLVGGLHICPPGKFPFFSNLDRLIRPLAECLLDVNVLNPLLQVGH